VSAVESGSKHALAAIYFDGRSAKAHSVQLQFSVDRLQLHIVGETVERNIKTSEVQWPERTRHGKRIAHLPGGGLVQTNDSEAWDAWQQAHGRHDSLVVKMQQSWRSVLVSVGLLMALLGAVYVWGLPLFADAVVSTIPREVDASLGDSALATIDSQLMQPSQMSADEQRRVELAWRQATAALPPGSAPQSTLVFRKSRIGPNAFALPGGTVVMTDELVKLVNGDTQVLIAVLAHELGHIEHRDGLRMLVQVTVLGSISSMLLGDFSTVLAAVPALLGQAQYSREAEHQADVYSLRVLKAAHIAPSAMVTLFDKLAEERSQRKPRSDEKPEESLLGIAFASHPTDADRIAFFKQAQP
jgi:Zn-dependent protease with chaperone function